MTSWAPEPGTPPAAEKLERDFREALTGAVAGTGLELRLDLSMPWIQEPGADGGYWIGIGLEQWTHVPSSQWRTFLFASWVSDDDDAADEPHCLDVYLAGSSARDVTVLAAMTVAAVTADLARKRVAR